MDTDVHVLMLARIFTPVMGTVGAIPTCVPDPWHVHCSINFRSSSGLFLGPVLSAQFLQSPPLLRADRHHGKPRDSQQFPTGKQRIALDLLERYGRVPAADRLHLEGDRFGIVAFR